MINEVNDVVSDIRGISKIEKKDTVNRNKNVTINQMKCQESCSNSKIKKNEDVDK